MTVFGGYGRWLIAVAGVVLATAAQADTVRGTARIGGVDTTVEVQLDANRGELRHRPATGSGKWQVLPIDGVGPALALMADTRLGFLHDPLAAWAGPGMVRLRDMTVERTRAAWEEGRASTRAAAPSQGAVRQRVRALLQYGVALEDAGRWGAATMLLRGERDRMPRKSDWDRAEWTAVSLNLAGSLVGQGDRDGAIAIVRETAAGVAGTPHAVNAEITLAALLAEAGRSDEALVQIDRALAMFRAVAGKGAVVPGAQLQFDWVRACALERLGRTAEAAALMAPFDTTPDPVSRRFAPPPNLELEERAYVCARDATAVARVWRRDAAMPAIGSDGFLSVQPAFDSPYRDGATMKHARALLGDPPGPVRMLGTEYDPALRGWR